MPKSRTKERRAAETIRFTADLGGDQQLRDRRSAALLVVQGAESDLGLHVVCDRAIHIGRDSEVELPLRDGSISRRHCVVELETATERYVLRDLGSTNGTRVNGSRVEQPIPLAEGDKIFLGASVVKFSYVDGFDVRYQNQLEQWVSTDALTGLLTLRKFEAAFHFAVQTARQEGTPLAVLVMDMDGLKKINDTHGHDHGGFAITETANLIRGVIEDLGECCRFGGDEFIAFLPRKTAHAAAQVAEKIRDAVAQHRYEKDGVHVAPTISIGVASFPEDGESQDELFRAADRALYKAKDAGKNRVALAGTAPPT